MSIETVSIPSKANLDKSLDLNTEESLVSRELSNPFFIASTYDISRIKPCQWVVKRCFDLLASSLGLVAITPLMLAVAIAIRLESPGPVIYRQTRVGMNGKTFNMYKFRSMQQNADNLLPQLMEKNEIGQGMFKLFDDPRITKIGKFIRKYSIDELPQLFNVLRGDMSLVGPRPPIQSELQHYKNWHYFRFATLPGLTGLWQVSGRSKIKEFDRVVKMDYQYINNWSLWLDLKLILKTLPVIVGGMDTA